MVSGRVIDMDSSNSVLYADRRVVADWPHGYGRRRYAGCNLICPEIPLSARRGSEMVEILKQTGAPEHLEHVTVFRPWGSYTVLEEGSGYKVKRVTVNRAADCHCSFTISGASTGW